MDLHQPDLRAVSARFCYVLWMRLVAVPALAVLALPGCPSLGSQGGECMMDRDCDDQVCARDGTCTDADEVREVTVTWTIRGAALCGPLAPSRSGLMEFGRKRTCRRMT